MKSDKSFQEEKEIMDVQEIIYHLKENFPKELLGLIVEFIPSKKQRMLDLFIPLLRHPTKVVVYCHEEMDFQPENLCFSFQDQTGIFNDITIGERRSMRREWADYIEGKVELAEEVFVEDDVKRWQAICEYEVEYSFKDFIESELWDPWYKVWYYYHEH